MPRRTEKPVWPDRESLVSVTRRHRGRACCIVHVQAQAILWLAGPSSTTDRIQISVCPPCPICGGKYADWMGAKKICAVFSTLISLAEICGKRDEVNLGAESLSWMVCGPHTGKDGLGRTGWSGFYFLFRCVLNMCV